MLCFTVQGSEELVERALGAAWLFGPEEVPVPAEISTVPIEGGALIRCEKHSAEPAGISLVQTDPSPGQPPLVLQTCLLQERERPYRLTLELARCRIMMILNKLEDWALFELPGDHPAMQTFESARRVFTKALVHQGGEHASPAEADRCAVEALELAIKASDQLVEAEVARRFVPRVTGAFYQKSASAAGAVGAKQNPPAPVKAHEGIGVSLPTKPFVAATVAPGRFGDAEIDAVRKTSDFLSLPMRWTELEPDEGKYNFQRTDRWIEWAVRKAKMSVVAGPVIDFSAKGAPEWLHIWEHDYETLREVVYEHVRSVVTRYRRTVPRWTIASGLHRNDNFALTFEQMMDLTRMAVLLTRKLHPSAKIQLEVVQPFSGDAGRASRSLPGVIYADMAAQSGIAVDAYSVRLELAAPNPTDVTRDLLALSATIDRFAVLERPLAVHAVTTTTFDAPGRAWLARAFEVIASKPWVYSIACQRLTPGDPNRSPAGLADAAGALADATGVLGDLRNAVRDGRRPGR